MDSFTRLVGFGLNDDNNRISSALLRLFNCLERPCETAFCLTHAYKGLDFRKMHGILIGV